MNPSPATVAPARSKMPETTQTSALPAPSAAPADEKYIEINDFSFSYGPKKTLHNVTLNIPERQVTAFIGPSGCGKTTLLRNLNRMNDLIDGVSHEGDIFIKGRSIYDPLLEVIALRKRVGMVFQKSNPFPKSIFENVIFSLRMAGQNNKKVLAESVERSLRGAALWDEVKDRLNDSALGMSGGQQQRLCIARAIANRPEILLMDEPCSALDPLATARVEELITQLKDEFTIVIVTHNMQQATRVSDGTAFFYLGKLIEYGNTRQLFNNPTQRQTEDYVTGRFG